MKICKTFSFCYAHRLHNDKLSDQQNAATFGKCNNKHYHGHNAILEVEIGGSVDSDTGMIMNFVDLKEVVSRLVVDKYDHKNLDLDFDAMDLSTSENFIRLIWLDLVDELPNLSKLVLWETPTSSCTMTAEDFNQSK